MVLDFGPPNRDWVSRAAAHPAEGWIDWSPSRSKRGSVETRQQPDLQAKPHYTDYLRATVVREARIDGIVRMYPRTRKYRGRLGQQEPLDAAAELVARWWAECLATP
jgi:hypothetical protein